MYCNPTNFLIILYSYCQVIVGTILFNLSFVYIEVLE